MKIIPVIDLMQGKVVQARRGERDTYRPIKSQLCRGSDALDIASALLQLYPFSTLYIADIDAIRQAGSNRHVIEKLHARFPALELWIDAGISNRAAFAAWLKTNLGHPVIGSESRPDKALLRSLCASAATPYPLLSLDFKDGFRGDKELLTQPELLLEHVIVMLLSRVGSDEGPDLAKLQRLQRRGPQKKFYAAGGVRGMRDLEALVRAGASGVLLASALHQRRIGAADLAHFTFEDETRSQ